MMIQTAHLDKGWKCTFKKGLSCADPEGDRRSGHPLQKNHKHIRVFSNPGPDPLKNYKTDGPAFNFGPMMVLLIVLFGFYLPTKKREKRCCLT